MRRLVPAEGASGDFDVPFHGYRFAGNLNSFVEWSVYFFGSYSAHELALLGTIAGRFEKREGRRPVFVDVGANVGNHTLFMASRSSRVVALEPFERVRSRLNDQVRRNGIANVTVLPIALGDRDEVVKFHYLRRHSNDGMGTTVPQKGWATTQAEMRRGDGIPVLAEADILKIDVEGAEAAVLAGLAETIRRRRPVILMELSEASRAAFASEQGLRAALYDNANIQAVGRGRLRAFALRPFDFATSDEVLITPR